MKTYTRDSVWEVTNTSKEKCHLRNVKLANYWWKYWGSKKILRVAKRGKYKTYIYAPKICLSEICDILCKNKFQFDTYGEGILTEIHINWA